MSSHAARHSASTTDFRPTGYQPLAASYLRETLASCVNSGIVQMVLKVVARSHGQQWLMHARNNKRPGLDSTGSLPAYEVPRPLSCMYAQLHAVLEGAAMQ